MTDSTAPKTTLRIPIRLAGAPGLRYATEPLTFGVPFAEGAFPAGAAKRDPACLGPAEAGGKGWLFPDAPRLRAVTADGRELPLQTAVMTTWKPDLKHIKWLLADLQANPARDGETVWLERADDPTDRSDPTDRITTTSADGLLTLDTGILRLTLRTDFPRWKKREWDSPFAGCAVRAPDGAWREALQGPGLLLYMKDQHGNLYTSLGACPAPTVVIEEQGPLRVCVLIIGCLMSEQGVRFCPYRLRLHLYAGKADLRIFHTFIFDQDPTRIQLQAIGLKACVKPGEGAAAALGGVDALSGLSDRSDKPDSLSVLQSDDLHYTVTRDGAAAGSGEKAPGWAALGGTNAGVVAAVRDFWQEYPKGLAVGRDALDVRVWPEDAPRPLSFLTPFDEPPIFFNGTRDQAEIKRLLAERPTAPLALQSFKIASLDDVRWVEETMERLAPGRAMSYCDFMGQSTGVGAAKTTEIVLRFTAGPVATDEATAFAAAVQVPLCGIVDPGHLCGTDVFGPFLPAGHPAFAAVDRRLTDIYERSMMDPLVRCRRYGMMLHGHLVNAHTGGASHLVYHYYKDTAPDKALRYVGPYNNEAMDLALGPWGQFLRTGDRRYLRQAQLTARAIADVSFVHADPGEPANVGCIHYHGAHVWSNTLNRSHSEVGTIMADYYLTGNRRALEVALEAADGLLLDKVEPCGILNCFAALYREFTGPLSILLEAYQATWHEKYGAPAERSLNWLLRTVRTPGWLPGSVYTRGPRGQEAVVDPECAPGAGACNPMHVFAPALRLFPSQALRDFVLAQAAWGHGLDAAFALTGDRRYAAAAYDGLMNMKMEDNEEVVRALFYHPCLSDLVPRNMKTAAQALDADPEGFREFVKRWREAGKPLTDVPPVRPETDKQPRGLSLGVLSLEP